MLALAPDAASRKAGDKLALPRPWSGTGQGGGALWGLCEGSGRTPYRTAVDLTDPAAPGYRCSCPSRKFPCKHALGLLLLAARDATAVPAGREAPEWAESWLAGRRDRAAGRAAGSPARGADAAGGEAGAAGRRAADPEAARRRAERRARRIAAGTEELERRLADLLQRGLAGADRPGRIGWEETAARMVDAQAPGLAARVRELAAIPGSGPDWPGRLLAECALLHLLDRGYQRLERLPPELAATVRTRVGLGIEAAALLAEHAERGTLVRDRWLVLGSHDRREDRLTARRIWLAGADTGRTALLLAFAAPGTAPEPALPPGTALTASLAFYPGGAPLRAALGERHAEPTAAGPPTGGGVREALAGYGRALAADPWLDGWPVVLSGVIPMPARRPPAAGAADPEQAGARIPAQRTAGAGISGPAAAGAGTSRAAAGPGPGGGAPGAGAAGGVGADTGSRWVLADERGEAALPLHPEAAEARWVLAAISGGGPVTVFGECGHRGFVPYTVWSEGEAITL